MSRRKFLFEIARVPCSPQPDGQFRQLTLYHDKSGDRLIFEQRIESHNEVFVHMAQTLKLGEQSLAYILERIGESGRSCLAQSSTREFLEHTWSLLCITSRKRPFAAFVECTREDGSTYFVRYEFGERVSLTIFVEGRKMNTYRRYDFFVSPDDYSGFTESILNYVANEYQCDP